MDSLILAINTATCAVSNYQNDESDEIQPEEWGLSFVQRCFVSGFNMEPNCKPIDKNCKSSIGFLDSLLLKEWEDRLQRGVFLYDVTACKTKILSGQFGFIAQLNEGRRLSNKPTKFLVKQVLQPFYESKFNFTKVPQEEILFQLEDTDSVVAINVSPIEYGHVILIPRITERLPQRIDHESFLLALQMAIEIGNPFFRMGYNSLSTCETVNHLHFQAYYFSASFPIEVANHGEFTNLTGSDVQISSLLNYPVKGFVFERGSTVELSKVVSKACVCLQDNNVPFSILIVECGRRVFLLPQRYCGNEDVGGIWEICGHMVFDQKRDFEEASEEKAVGLLGNVSLSVERFSEVFGLVFEFINGDCDLSLATRGM